MTTVSNEQEAQQVVIRHIGGFAWPTLLLALACLGIYLVCIYHLLVSPDFSIWVLLGVTFCAYAMYTPLHDAVHGAVTGMSLEQRWINEWVGYVAAHILGITFTGHRRSHLKHHRATNHPTDDPDMVLSARTPARLLIAWMHGLPKEWLFIASFKHFTEAEKAVLKREAIAVVAGRALILIFCADFGVTFFTLLAGHFVGTAILVTLFAWSVHHPHTEQERMKTTTVYRARPGLDTVMTLGWGFQNYHAIHHLYPKVPFFRYRCLFKALEPYLTAGGVPVRQLI